MKQSYDMNHGQLLKYMKSQFPDGGWVIRGNEIEAEPSLLPGSEQVIQNVLDGIPEPRHRDILVELDALDARITALETP